MVRVPKVGWTEDGMSADGVESEISGGRDEVSFFLIGVVALCLYFSKWLYELSFLCIRVSISRQASFLSVCLYWKPHLIVEPQIKSFSPGLPLKVSAHIEHL